MTHPHQNDVPSETPPLVKETLGAPSRTKKTFSTLSASAIGLEMGISVVIGVLFGMWLDKQIGTTPWMMVLFLGFGLAAGFRSILRAAKRTERDEREGKLG